MLNAVPMMSQYSIRLSPPDIPLEVVKKASELFHDNIENSRNGSSVFEQDVSNVILSKYALATNSGTSALHLALLAIGVKAGDEVLCPTFTFVAVANAIRYLNAVPVFIDVEMESWNICPDLVEQALLDRVEKTGKLPKAIITGHNYGVPADLGRLSDILSRYDLPLIEDAAGALGSKWKDTYVGTIGVLGIYSFNYNKIITTAGGGILVSNIAEPIDKARYLASQAKSGTNIYRHGCVGYNYVMGAMAAELGSIQLPYLTQNIARRREIYCFYKDSLSDIFWFLEDDENRFSNRWLTTILCENGDHLMKVISNFSKKRVEYRNLWYPLHLQPAFREFPVYEQGNAEALFESGLCVPSSHRLSDSDVNQIVSAMRCK